MTQGAADIATLGPPENNHTSCGTLLFSVVQDGARMHASLGTIGGAPGLRPQAHVFVDSQAPWFGITDALPQVERLRPG